MYNCVKNILTVLTLLFLPGICFSQTASTTATTTAYIAKGVSFSSESRDAFSTDDIDFGDILIKTTPQSFTMLPQDGRRFKATGEVGKTFTTTYSLSVTLSNATWAARYGAPTGTIVFTTATAKKTGTNPNYVNPQNLPNGGTTVFQNVNGEGVCYIWVGGTLNVPANHRAGEYVGTFNITVSY
jgi:hypothetical protein